MSEKSAYHEELVFENQQEVNQTKFLVPAAVLVQMATVKPLLETIQLKVLDAKRTTIKAIAKTKLLFNVNGLPFDFADSDMYRVMQPQDCAFSQ